MKRSGEHNWAERGVASLEFLMGKSRFSGSAGDSLLESVSQLGMNGNIIGGI
jgi:hypothetical protein